MQPYRQMAVFVAVVEGKGFTAAARKLGVAVSAVSRMVAELEAHAGVSLLSRTTRRLALTEPGTAYFESCRRMVAEAEGAAAALVGRELEPTGCLRLTVAIGMARHVMPVLAELGAAHPRLELDVRLEDRYADLVAEDIDLAVRGGDLEDSSLIARPVADVVYVVCAAPAYLQRRGLPRKPADPPITNGFITSRARGSSPGGTPGGPSTCGFAGVFAPTAARPCWSCCARGPAWRWHHSGRSSTISAQES